MASFAKSEYDSSEEHEVWYHKCVRTLELLIHYSNVRYDSEHLKCGSIVLLLFNLTLNEDWC